MAKLTDFEDLLSKVKNPLIKDYMQEAMYCYFAEAYRGCIVMSYISLFDDLIHKLHSIKDVNSDAKAIYLEVERRKNAQDVFENYLMDQLRSKNLISELDASTIDLIRDRRNKSAHPSGHHPSSEEARYIYFEVVDKFLSKKTLGTKHLVDEIIVRLKNNNFFTSNFISDLEETVRHETCNVHESAYPYLVIKIVESYNSSDSTTKNNSSFFLDGLSKIDDEKINDSIIKHFLSKNLDQENMTTKCFSIISSNPSLFKMLNDVDKKRFKALLKQKIETVLSTTGLSQKSLEIG